MSKYVTFVVAMPVQLPILSPWKKILVFNLICFVFFSSLLAFPKFEQIRKVSGETASYLKGGHLNFHAILEKDLKHSPIDNQVKKPVNPISILWVGHAKSSVSLQEVTGVCVNKDRWEIQKIVSIFQKLTIFPFHSHW